MSLVKQTATEPAYEDMLWAKPETQQARGKLLIIGGNAQSISAPMEAFGIATKAGAGSIHVLLPQALRSVAGRILEHGAYAPSTPSGSFSRRALDSFLQEAQWADSVLLAGSLGRNSETAIVIDSFLAKHNGPVIITRDAADYIIASPDVLNRAANTVLVISIAQLQKLGKALKLAQPITFSMDLLQLTSLLRDLSSTHGITFVVLHLEHIIVAHDGQVSATTLNADPEVWRVKTAAYASVWLMQHPNKPFEALTTAIHESIAK
jgi:hypothetical protein